MVPTAAGRMRGREGRYMYLAVNGNSLEQRHRKDAFTEILPHHWRAHLCQNLTRLGRMRPPHWTAHYRNTSSQSITTSCLAASDLPSEGGERNSFSAVEIALLTATFHTCTYRAAKQVRSSPQQTTAMLPLPTIKAAAQLSGADGVPERRRVAENEGIRERCPPP